MAEQSFVQVAPNSTGAKIDGVAITQDDATQVQRQVIVLGDSAAAGNYASVNGNGALKVAIDPTAGGQPVSLSPAGTPQLLSSPIDFSASGDATIVNGVSGKKISVHRLFLTVEAATSIQFKDGTNALTGAMPLNDGGGIALDFDGEPWFQTTIGQAFKINSSNGGQCGGRIYYALV